MRIVSLVSLVVLSVVISSCSTLHTENSSPSISIDITMPEPNRLRFSGKGSGAGMMLMSSMGPVGMAVGVAIDEGIGKDIAAQLDAQQVNMENALQQTLLQSLKSVPCHRGEISLEVQRYGFKTWGSAEFPDPISPEFKFIVKGQGQPDILIDYPSLFEGDLPLIPLEEAKVNGAVSKAALLNALALIGAEIKKQFNHCG